MDGSSGHLATDRPISVAILAMGGQGGGVLSDWVVALAEAQGWVAQSTSVPGVAQRTGATIYYVELIAARHGALPVLSLMPTPGDVDIVLAAEFMEAGRAMLRGLVDPERTTLIASSHRSYAIVEKQVPGDGRGDLRTVVEAAGVAAKRVITFDMQSLAEQNGSVISAALFGALASAEVLPFSRAAFEAAIRAGGKGVEPSIRAFSAAFDRARGEQPDPVPLDKARTRPLPDSAGHPELDRLLDRIRSSFPAAAHPMLFAGISRLIDYQDVAYAQEYLDRIAKLLLVDEGTGGPSRDFAFTNEAAKYLAAAMAYDDLIRVADLKTRSTRFARVRVEVGAKANQVVYMTEYMHPRMDEIAGSLPATIGRYLERRPSLFRALDRIVNRGRRVRTGTISWFVVLHLLSKARRFRRGSLRHQRETEHIEHWLDVAVANAPRNYDLAVETILCRRLVKGYSDTHARGLSKFDRLLATVPGLSGIPDGAAWLGRLKAAALADEEGKTLDGAIKTISTEYPGLLSSQGWQGAVAT